MIITWPESIYDETHITISDELRKRWQWSNNFRSYNESNICSIYSLFDQKIVWLSPISRKFCFINSIYVIPNYGYKNYGNFTFWVQIVVRECSVIPELKGLCLIDMSRLQYRITKQPLLIAKLWIYQTIFRSCFLSTYVIWEKQWYTLTSPLCHHKWTLTKLITWTPT